MFGKSIVAAVVCRNRHNSTCTITSQHIVWYPYRDRLVREWVFSIRPWKHTAHFLISHAFKFCLFVRLGYVLFYSFMLRSCGELLHQFAFWCKHHKSNTKDSVGTCCEYRNYLIAYLFAHRNICCRNSLYILFKCLSYCVRISHHFRLCKWNNTKTT